MVKIAKFGGTSVKDASALLAVANIIKTNPDIRIAVFSAVAGITNKLLKLFNEPYVNRIDLYKSIVDIHNEIASELGFDDNLEQFKEIIDELQNLTNHAKTLADLDSLLAIGERLSSFLITTLLQKMGIDAVYIDAREFIITDDCFGKALPDIEQIKLSCTNKLKHLIANHIVITQGFIGSTPDGFTTTLGRGGSDFSAALFAEALEAEILEIYTDVKGVYTCDPNLLAQAKLIDKINYSEMSALANFGAKVLHPATLLPCIRAKIPLLVKSTFYPNEGGTLVEIDNKVNNDINANLVSFAVRRNQILVTIKSINIINNCDFFRHIFDVLQHFKICVDIITLSEASVVLVVDGTNLGSHAINPFSNQKILEEFKKVAEITVEEGFTLVTLVGKRLISDTDIVKKILAVITDYPIRLISYGASSINFSLLVYNQDMDSIAKILHKNIFE